MFVLIAVGPTLSGLQLTEGFVDVEKFFWAAFGLWVRPNYGCVGGALEYSDYRGHSLIILYVF